MLADISGFDNFFFLERFYESNLARGFKMAAKNNVRWSRQVSSQRHKFKFASYFELKILQLKPQKKQEDGLNLIESIINMSVL